MYRSFIMTSFFTRILYVIVVLTLFEEVHTIHAQSTSTERYGVFGGYSINFHTADFRALPGVPNCCPKFENGTGGGFAIGALYEFSISKKIWVTLRAGYSTLDATLVREEYVPALRLSDGQYYPDAAIEHRIKAKLSTIGITPMITFNPIGGLRFHTGVEMSSLGGVTYEQVEEMKAEGLVFKENFKRTRNEFSGELSEVNKFQTSLIIGASMELPLNRSRSMVIAPEAMFHIGLSNLTESVVWKANAFQIGIALKYAPQSASQTPSTVPQVPTVTSPQIVETPTKENTEKTKVTSKPSVKPTLKFDVFGISEKGEKSPINGVRIEEFISTQLKPLLPYVFFESNSSKIPDRYSSLSQSEKASFSLNEAAHSQTLDVYYQILNIIGKRMIENPDAILKLTGCNSDVGEERGQKNLSASRAEAVRNYLVNVWSIPSKRIKTESRNLPGNPSRSADIDVSASDAENRRVEFSSENSAILAPVMSRDTLRNVSPAILRFNTEKDVNVTISSKDKVLSTVKSDALHPVDFRLSDFVSSIGESIEVVGSKDKTSQEKTIPVELLTLRRKIDEQRADKTVDKYSLIVFDFDRSDLSSPNKSIAEFVKSSLTPRSTVSISGTTDHLGDEAYNRKLSFDRAKATATALGLTNAELSGDGESDFFPNALPEGRFYNRTVVITVETPK